MRALGCRPPDVVTRVTDYMDTIIAYIQQICDNGMAYAHEGTVRFNSQAFRYYEKELTAIICLY